MCRKLIDMMIQMLGTETSNVSVRTLCYSGIYIVGNIVQALLDYLIKTKNELFMVKKLENLSYFVRNRFIIKIK